MLFSGIGVSILWPAGFQAPNVLLVHSQVLPTSCRTPLRLAPSGKAWAAIVWSKPLPQMLALRRSIESPQGKRRCTGFGDSAMTGQLAALTHSGSVGKRLPAQRA